MSLRENEIALIHSKTTFQGGKKHFGDLDGYVSKGQIDEKLKSSLSTPDTTVLVPVMERGAKFNLFIDTLAESIGNSNLGASVVIIDNSLEPGLLRSLREGLYAEALSVFGNVYYHHDPRATQSSGRNVAYKTFDDDAWSYGVWDSDIYSSKRTVSLVVDRLKHNIDLSGLAPPMGKYNGGNLIKARNVYKDMDGSKSVRLKLHMPGEIGEENGVWDGDVMGTTMMRGAFFVKRDMLEQIAEHNPDGNPWLEDFVLWQNVPFFIAARELNLDFGYLMNGASVVLHDDRVDNLSVGYSMPYRRIETLRSILMLMSRNEITQTNTSQSRFLEYTTPSITRVTGYKKEETVFFRDVLIGVAKIICESDNSEAFLEQFEFFCSSLKEPHSTLIRDVVKTLSEPTVFERVKKIKSLDLSRTIYSVE